MEELPKNRGLGQCTDLRGDLARNSGADTQIYTYIHNIYIYIYNIYIHTHIYIYPEIFGTWCFKKFRKSNVSGLLLSQYPMM